MPRLTNKRLYSLLNEVDLPFLLFLIGVTYVKVYIKLLSIFLYFFYIIAGKVKLSRTITGVEKFYLLIPLLGIVRPLLDHSAHGNYLYGYLFGALEWIVCAAAFHLTYITVSSISKNKMVKTVECFFILNTVVSIGQLAVVMFDAHSFMPYWITDSLGKFGASTGDALYGVFGNSSINNAAVSILGAIYFLYHKNILLASMCILVMLLCTSNTSIIIALTALALIFLSRKHLRKNACILIVLIVFLYPALSPANLSYVKNLYMTFVLKVPTNYQNPDSLKVFGAVKNVDTQTTQSIAQISVAENNIYELLPMDKNEQGYIDILIELKQSNDKYRKYDNSVATLDPSQVKYTFMSLYGIPSTNAPLSFYGKPGKIYSFMQTVNYLKSSFQNLLFGAGSGNFSSKLAIKMTGLGIQGKYPTKRIYVNNSFLEYHLYTILYFFCQNIGLHSTLNMPNSVYNQILGEYGLVGTFAFIFLYIAFFIKNLKMKSYGIFLLFVLLFFFLMDYWFEMASLTVIFELLMLMDIFVFTKSNADIPTNNSINAGV